MAHAGDNAGARRVWTGLVAGLIAGLGILIYWPALRGTWVWDDQIDIVQNAVLRDPAGWWKIWVEPAGWHFFPLKSEVQWWQWRWLGTNTLGYHITNVTLHVVSALLVWRVLSRLGLRWAWLGGLLFVVHPVAVESVAWIAELKNTLSLPLVLLAFDAWLDFEERARGRDYARALLLFVAAMLAKSSVVMFPLMILLYALGRRGRIGVGDICATAPFIAISAALGGVTVWFEHHQDLGLLTMPDYGFASRVAGAGLAVGFYLWKGVFPTGLSPVYPDWKLDEASPALFLPWLVLGLATLFCWRGRRSWGGPVGFGLGCFVLSVFPALGFVPMAYHHIAWVADHFAYLALIPVVGLAAAGIGAMSAHFGPVGRRAVIGVIAVIVLTFAMTSRDLAAAFRDEESLWRHAIRQYPDTWLPHHNLGLLLAHTERLDEAVQHYRAALQLRPNEAATLNNLGNAELERGNLAGAVAAYTQAAVSRPDFAEVQANLGRALARAGRKAEAGAACEQALRLKPDYAPAHFVLGDLCAESGRSAAAITHYESALRVEPEVIDARVNLGFALRESGRTEDAIAQWREAIRRAPTAVEARIALGGVLVETGHPGEAAEQLGFAARARPEDADVHNNLAYAFAQLGRIEDAIRECDAALRLRPGDAGIRENRERLRLLARE